MNTNWQYIDFKYEHVSVTFIIHMYIEITAKNTQLISPLSNITHYLKFSIIWQPLIPLLVRLIHFFMCWYPTGSFLFMAKTFVHLVQFWQECNFCDKLSRVFYSKCGIQIWSNLLFLFIIFDFIWFPVSKIETTLVGKKIPGFYRKVGLWGPPLKLQNLTTDRFSIKVASVI